MVDQDQKHWLNQPVTLPQSGAGSVPTQARNQRFPYVLPDQLFKKVVEAGGLPEGTDMGKLLEEEVCVVCV